VASAGGSRIELGCQNTRITSPNGWSFADHVFSFALKNGALREVHRLVHQGLDASIGDQTRRKKRFTQLGDLINQGFDYAKNN
jgi:hypothetical protein